MANAIVKTERGDTLASIAARYYALHNSGGSGRASELGKVTQAIRRATPTRLAHLADRDPVPPGTTLFVPTLRELHRAVLTDNVHLLGALRAHGLDHARKLFRYSVDQVVALLQPLPPSTTREDIERAWMLTALANLDGMDHYTARHLYDEVGIHSLQELARQSPATLDKVLQALVAPPHSRPPELAAQRHGERWIVSAKILVRKRLGELAKIKGRFFQVPFGAALAQRRAEHYEAVVGDESLTSEEAGLASRLGRLYRFQAALLRGNVGVRSGNWAEAIAGYQEARRHWHRLAEATGAASAVNDDDGLNLNDLHRGGPASLVDSPRRRRSASGCARPSPSPGWDPGALSPPRFQLRGAGAEPTGRDPGTPRLGARPPAAQKGAGASPASGTEQDLAGAPGSRSESREGTRSGGRDDPGA